MRMIPGMGGNPRQLAMMMRKLGIDVEDVEGVEEVVVRTKTHEYRFTKATVSIMRAQGTETWQVVGKPSKAERGAKAPVAPAPAGAASGAGKAAAPAPSTAEPAAPVAISDADVALVAKETGKSPAEARKALEATGGDLAEAIVRLT